MLPERRVGPPSGARALVLPAVLRRLRARSSQPAQRAPGQGAATEAGGEGADGTRFDRPQRVLIVSASMGAGHDGAARELANRLEARGHAVQVRDFLDAGPLRIGPALRSGYEFELRHVPSAYDATYRFWHRVPWMAPVVAWLVMALTRRRVMRWVRDLEPDVMVSTYPLSTLCVGRLRTTHRLGVPAVNFITDFGVHPLWVHRGMDLNLAVHEGPAELARQRTHRPGVACGPLVAERFDPETAAGPGGRAARRRHLGLTADDIAVLIVAGSWGVGGLRETFDAVAAIPGAVPVVVCGRDETLLHRVQQAATDDGVRAVVLGWTDEMPALMAASDVLVENAGGLTAFEAMRVGLPVVSYRPIAGHGVENTAAMADAGVSVVAADPAGLAEALRTVGRPGPARDTQVATARSMFVSDAADGVLGVIPTETVPMRRRGRQPGVIARRLAGSLAAIAALGWLGLTTGVGVAAANGAGVAHPVAGAGSVLYLGIRLDGAQLADPQVVRASEASAATIVLDGRTAADDPAAVLALAGRGVDIANGGQGRPAGATDQAEQLAPWTRAHQDVDAGTALAALVGHPVAVFAPGRRVNAFDLVDADQADDRLVVPGSEIHLRSHPGAVQTAALTPRSIMLVDGLGATPAQLTASLTRLEQRLTAAGLTVRPLAALR